MPASRPFGETRNVLLQDREIAAKYLEEALASDDIDLLKLALTHVAQAHAGGVAELAEKSEVTRVQLTRTLSPTGTPRVDVLSKILNALELRISIVPQVQSNASAKAVAPAKTVVLAKGA